MALLAAIESARGRGILIGMCADESFPRTVRIRAQADFDRTYADGIIAMDARLVIHAAPNQLGYCRLGVSLSRKVGNSPTRNRWKRVIREAFRRSQHLLPRGVDLVVRPRKGAVCAFRPIQESLAKLSERLARNLERKS